MRDHHAAIAAELDASPFDRPLRIESSEQGGALQGQVEARLGIAFDDLADVLAEPQHWCELLVLLPNLRQCRVQDDGRRMQLRFARRFDQPVADAHAVVFDAAIARGPDRLDVELSADRGPVGTRHYLVALHAVPVDAGHSFLQVQYGYSYGFTARVAAQAYLSTRGSDKVGFSREGGDYIGGLRGAIERYSMRLYLAVEAYFDALDAPPDERHERALRTWLASIEDYPRQLAEADPDAYFEAKRRRL